MKKITLFTTAFLAAAIAAAAVAQNSETKEMTYTGCVESGKEAGTYMLTHTMAGDGMAKSSESKEAATGVPKMLELESAGATIGPHLGHKVTVMGRTMTDKMGTKMMVGSLKMLSTTCP